MPKVRFSAPPYRWLFGGLGFHNSEASMTRLMPAHFRDERVLKTFRELSPTFSRIYAGFADWTDSAISAFSDYYHQTFAQSDCTIYAVPGRIPPHETAAERAAFADAIAERLDTLVHAHDVRLLRYFCITNELSVGNTYAKLAHDFPAFVDYHQQLYRAFRQHNLDIGLLATDTSGISTYWQINWAAAHMDELTAAYCAHNYDSLGYAFDDPGYYHALFNAFRGPVQTARRMSKRFILGEFGVHNEREHMRNTDVMIDDVPAGYGDPRQEARAALMACVQALAALNSGVYAAAFWSMCDYPDPFIPDNGHTPDAEARYETARFSGFGTSIRYNKNGLFRWSETGDYSPRAYLYSYGLMTKFFRKHSRVLAAQTDDPHLICGGVTNPDGSAAICLINLHPDPAEVTVACDFPRAQPFRAYEYLCDQVPENPFGDLQPFTIPDLSDSSDFTRTLPPYSLTLLTTDYADRTPAAVKCRTADGALHWDAPDDPSHRYFRIYRGGAQIASTVAHHWTVAPGADPSEYTVRSVDASGNVGF